MLHRPPTRHPLARLRRYTGQRLSSSWTDDRVLQTMPVGTAAVLIADDPVGVMADAERLGAFVAR